MIRVDRRPVHAEPGQGRTRDRLRDRADVRGSRAAAAADDARAAREPDACVRGELRGRRVVGARRAGAHRAGRPDSRTRRTVVPMRRAAGAPGSRAAPAGNSRRPGRARARRRRRARPPAARSRAAARRVAREAHPDRKPRRLRSLHGGARFADVVHGLDEQQIGAGAREIRGVLGVFARERDVVRREIGSPAVFERRHRAGDETRRDRSRGARFRSRSASTRLRVRRARRARERAPGCGRYWR